MLPTIDACSVQWKLSALPPRTVKARLVAPGAMSPRLAEPSSITMRCSVLSLLRNITVSPVAARTGLGWKAVLPEEPTTDTVTVVVAGGGGEVLGPVGVEPPPPPPPPQPQADAARSAAARVPETSRDCMRDLKRRGR